MDPVLVPSQPTAPAWKGWGASPAPQASRNSFRSVMDEEFARNLQREEEARCPNATVEATEPRCAAEAAPTQAAPAHAAPAQDAPAQAAPDSTQADEEIARLLQEEYDRDHDESLRAREKHMNGKSNVTVSLFNFQRSQYPQECDLDTMQDEDEYDNEVIPQQASKPMAHPGGGGGGGGRRRKRRAGKDTPTKHDATICGQHNARRMEEALPPGVAIGHLENEDGTPMCLSKHSMGAIARHSKHHGRDKARREENRDHATQNKFIDRKTEDLLKGMSDDVYITELCGVISTGKEACVLHAFGESEYETEYNDSDDDDADAPIADAPKNHTETQVEYAVKIYKTTLTDFKTRERYIRGDNRFSDRFSSQNPRKVVHLWAEKEFRNLRRLRKAGLPCPEPLALKEHVLVMSFIGHEGKPAPQLRNAQLTDSQKQRAYEQSIILMTRMFRDCHLVHADLSQYNLLWHDRQLYVIDVSQSVEPWHEDAMGFLYRDANALVTFFRKLGVKKVADPRQIMCDVTGFAVDPNERKEIFLEKMAKLADKNGSKHKHSFEQYGTPPGESFEEMYERGLHENERLKAEKKMLRELEEAGVEVEGSEAIDVDAI